MAREEKFKLKILKAEMDIRVYVDKLPESCAECPAKMQKYGMVQCKYIAHLPGTRGHEMWHPTFTCPTDRRYHECPLIERPMSSEEKERERDEKNMRDLERRQQKIKHDMELKAKSDSSKPNRAFPCDTCYYAHVAKKEPARKMTGGHGWSMQRPVYCNMTGEKKMLTDEQSYILYYFGKSANDKRDIYDILPEWCPRRNLP